MITGESQFIWTGVLLQVGAIISEALRSTCIQILLQKKGVRLNPIATLYYIAPCCFVFLLVPFLWYEAGAILASEAALGSLIPLLFFNCLCAFGMNTVCLQIPNYMNCHHRIMLMYSNKLRVCEALNLTFFLLIGKTSALTVNVAGVVKDWLLIALSFFIYR